MSESCDEKIRDLAIPLSLVLVHRDRCLSGGVPLPFRPPLTLRFSVRSSCCAQHSHAAAAAAAIV